MAGDAACPACGSSVDSTADGAEADAAAEADTSPVSAVSLADGELALYGTSVVHDIEITFDDDAYDAIVAFEGRLNSTTLSVACDPRLIGWARWSPGHTVLRSDGSKSSVRTDSTGK